jgi:hypothetical protein
MDVVLRTVLRNLDIQPATTPGEKMRTGGLGFLPSGGGRVTVRRRTIAAA